MCEFIFYRATGEKRILEQVCGLIARAKQGEKSADFEEISYEVLHELTDMAENYGLEGNLWHTYLAWLIVNHENAFSTSCEIRGLAQGSQTQLASHDFQLFKELIDYDLSLIWDAPILQHICNYKSGNEKGRAFNKRIRDRICDMSRKLETAGDAAELMEEAARFYKEFGVGKLGLHKAFRIAHDEKGVHIVPIRNIPHVNLDDLVGYETPKKKLLENTEAFVEGRTANNCLLFGDAGTGKSSSIKGILNRYYDQGLRIIEVYKHQFQDIHAVISQIKNRNYRFILYMDDLSFEEFEVEYKYLKAVIEGGLEKKPDNVLIYATSNRRHLIKENFSDKEGRRDQLHPSDTTQEKLSLVARFGVTIFFISPDRKEFQEIVRTLAARAGIQMEEEELMLEANRWELNHGGLSGRTAQQFIDYLNGQNK